MGEGLGEGWEGCGERRGVGGERGEGEAGGVRAVCSSG